MRDPCPVLVASGGKWRRWRYRSSMGSNFEPMRHMRTSFGYLLTPGISVRNGWVHLR